MKLVELKPGDWVLLNDEGITREGTVVDISTSDHQVCANNGIQEFWYDLNQVFGMPLNDHTMLRLGFEKMASETGVKYGKGAFRVIAPSENDFSNLEIWYREDKRHFDHPVMVHELQNVHYQMTKMSLEA
ncbi:MAG: hypothetical protein E6Q95_00875 [Chitinophagaceae bacterium]|nr:MAG: hypothetical protein E6Q95_00875 [Chitinophagaceae bacterium]